MTYRDQWEPLAARIRGLMQAGELHARFLSVRANDQFARRRRLHEQSKRTLTELQSFKTAFQRSLPPAALATIENFVQDVTPLIEATDGTNDAKQERVWAILVLLGAFETEMTFLLSDMQEVIRAKSERAFSHLQRLIVAAPIIREQWQDAFYNGETACEKLGGAHLLLHGIYAFKTNAEGERTDLVFQEPAGDLIDEQRYADGLVLTEWKKAARDEDAPTCFQEARRQAHLYAQGLLGGSELSAYRYAVVISRRHVHTPSDIIEGGISYRHINIAVQPQTPSQRA